MYWINNFQDPFEQEVGTIPDCLGMTEELWSSIIALREQFTMKFIELYARHDSDNSVIDAYAQKFTVDKIITLFIGEEKSMHTSQYECVKFCEIYFNYQIPALHALLRPTYMLKHEKYCEF